MAGIATCAIVGLSGCGEQAAPQPVDARTAAAVHSLARDVYQSFAGSRAQQDAGEVVAAWVVNGPTDRCLAEAGYPEWDWSLSRGYAVPYDPLAPSELFAELGRPVWSEREIAMRHYLAAEREMNADGARSRAYEQAIDRCSATVGRSSDAEISESHAPTGSADLVEAWRSMLYDARDELGGGIEDFTACMEDASIPVLDDAGRGYDEVGPAMTQAAARAGPPPSASDDPATYSPRWQHYLALEADLVEADVACRRDIHDAHIAELGPLIEAFAEDHQSEIQRIEDGWVTLEDHAAQLGYRGRPGPLGG